ncbi:MAG: FMN-binding protein [Bacteroidales bacterium]|nr:FMN-binding protein [Bacteroidales bacterium]
MNRNSNVYTVIYATVLTVLVAIMLTVAALGLAPQQKANSDNEKKQQILSSISSVLGKDVTFENAADIWSELDMDNNMCVVNTKGEELKGIDAFEIVAKQQFKAGVVKDEATLPLFKAIVNGKTYYIMALYGAGLWDAVWGYLSVESDCSTIAGASFDHASETAGLGAKIKDDPSFAASFIGKHVFQGENFAPVQVLKQGKSAANGADQVDAITGATKTSDCVSIIINNSLTGYKAYLLALRNTPCESAQAAECAACDSTQIVEPVNKAE